MSEYIDNQTQRQALLKDLIRRLHEGEPLEAVKQDFAAQLGDATAGEIAEMEQALIAEGVTEEQIKQLCDVHVAVFRESLDTQAPAETTPGHPIFTMRAENLAVGRILAQLGEALEDLKNLPGPSTLAAAHAQLAKLRVYERHYLRKENILFSYLEKHGFHGPSSVMWAIHDDIRRMWKELAALLADESPDPAAFDGVFGPLDTAIREMIYKEEHILFPAALERLSEAEWGAIRDQEPEIGFCYVLPGKQWQPRLDPRAAEEQAITPPAPTGAGGVIPLDVGALTPEQLNLLLTTLPIDVTFVDETDTVRFYSQTRERIFPRTPAIIGRQVQNCHPPQSMGRVQQILDDFRAGTRDAAEFWIQMGGKFIHIRYFALRGAVGAYRGTLEVTQDLAPLRALEGERRLLNE